MTISNIQTLIKAELQSVQDVVCNEIDTTTEIINSISQHITSSGGKKLRPSIVLLGAKCFNNSSVEAINLATVIEFFHISSLLHDDVIDNANIRRGKETAHNIWGNKSAILVGDYLFSKAFQILVTVQDHRILKILANTSNIITQGEVQQLMASHNPDITINEYMDIIHHKTAALFEAAAQMGALLENRADYEIKAMEEYGHYLGKAFQIADDIFDSQIETDKLGKNTGNDLKEGKMTIPLIYAIKHGNSEQQNIIKKAIINADDSDLKKVQQVLLDTDAIGLSKKLANKQVNIAITNLLKIEPSKYRDALESLALFAVERSY